MAGTSAAARKTLRSALTMDVIMALALPSNIRYGHAIHTRCGVQIITLNSKSAEAWVGGLSGSVAEGGSQKRRTRISLTSKGLEWHCTGNPSKHQVFCKHCVALALHIQNRKTRAH